ncbi:MAG: AAA family ATPase [Gemmatimonas sp.]|nr:AAA family ATPase [Gemmatimonas sp.]
MRLGRQRILFVGGKGGVGKTTTAGALALTLADRGERCILVSTDPAHSLGDLFDRRIGDRELAIAPNLWGLEIDPEGQVEQHLDQVKTTMRDLVKPDLYPEIERQMSLTRLSPGAVEAAMLERMAQLMISGGERYDRVIFDTAPTGHTLRLLSLPEIMAAWTDGLLRHRNRSDSWNRALKKLGPRPGVGDDISFLDAPTEPGDEQSARIREVLLDRRRKFYQARRLLLEPGTSAFILVLIPEKLPILESRKAVASLDEVKVPILALVVNRVLPSEPLGDFLEQRRQQEAAYLREIESLFPDRDRVYIPLLPRDVVGMENLRGIGRWLLPPAVTPG